MINVNITCEGSKVSVNATEQNERGIVMHVHVEADNIVDAVVGLMNRFDSARREVYERLKELGIINEPEEDAETGDMPS